LVLTLDDAVHEDAGCVDHVGIERADGYYLLHLGNADAPAGGGVRIEITRGLAIDEVSGRIALPGFDNRQVGDDPALENIGLAVEFLVVLALGDHRADAGLGVEARDTGAAGAHPLGKGAL